MTDQQNPAPENDKPTPQAAPAAPGTDPGKQSGDTQPQAETFTKEQVNGMMVTRLKEKEAEILKKLGITSIDEGKSAVVKVKELEDANKSELEKLQGKLTAAEQKAVEAVQNMQKALYKSSFVIEAMKPGNVAGDRLEAAYKLLDTSALKITDDGKVEGVTEALKALLEANPFLKAEEPKPTPQEKPKGTVQPTNPAGATPGYDLSWFKLSGGEGGGFRRGGVVPPTGE